FHLDTETYEFILVTADNTQWHFEATSAADRDDWIHHIDRVIHNRLRSGAVVVRDDSGYDPVSVTCSAAPKTPLDRLDNRVGQRRPLSFTTTATGDFTDGAGEDVCGQEEVLQRLTALPGNGCCADCGALIHHLALSYSIPDLREPVVVVKNSSSFEDYIDGQHCKWIDLTISTVKLPGLPYRMSGGGTQLGTTSGSDTVPGSLSQGAVDMCSSFILLSSPSTSQGTTTSTPVAQDGLMGVTSQLESLSLMDGKSALVHYFLTGIFVKDESPEGGRFKKLCFVRSHPCLLLIRDEAGPPDMQLANWIDALVLVVSLADVESVRTAHNYLALLRGLVDLSSVPMALVATQDSVINGTPAPEVEPHIRQLIAAMDSCPYYETCAVYGLNVQPVFEDILSRVLARRSNQKLPHLSNEPQPTNVSDKHSFHSSPIADTRSSTTVQVDAHEAYTQLSIVPAVPTPSTLPSMASKFPDAKARTANLTSSAPNFIGPPGPVTPISHDPWSLHQHPMNGLVPVSSMTLTCHPTVPNRPPALQLLQPFRYALGPPEASALTTGALQSSWMLKPTTRPTVGPAPLHPFGPQVGHYPTSAPAYPNDLAYRPNFHSISSWTEPTLQPIVVTQYRQLQPNPLSGSSLVAAPMSYRPELCASNNVRAASSISSELDLSGAHHLRSTKTAASHTVCAFESSPSQIQPGSLVTSVLNAPRRPDVDQGPTQSQAPAEDEAVDQGRRDRPRPQSTGSLTGGPLAGLASATLCAAGLHAPSPSARQQQRDNLGGGRLIPIKQGCLYKLNTQRLSKEIKRKKKKAQPTSNREVRSAWIQTKYVRRLFLPPLPVATRPIQQDLADALLRKDARGVLLCLAVCGCFARPQTINSERCLVNQPYSIYDLWTPLHLAAALGDLASLQLLLWHGVEVNYTDQFGLTAWSYAQVCRQDTCGRLLQLHGCHTVSAVNVPADWLRRIQNPNDWSRAGCCLLRELSPHSKTDPESDSQSYTSSCDSSPGQGCSSGSANPKSG
ncbi:hypothetical protein AHF37_03322, partial [Paragonimus kellicotti]